MFCKSQSLHKQTCHYYKSHSWWHSRC